MENTEITFKSLELSENLLRALDDLGFTKPSPIQAECIPLLLADRDVLGMAQTGSGKTAAFSLPFLSKIEVENRQPQLLVLAPTRELAIQVADACQQYAKYIPQLSVLALYGGQRYDVQLRALRHGAQIVVGTPGRLLDHLKRGTLKLSNLKGVVLDEADEMLRMGFIDDVESIMAQLPAEHQTALFSATMPEPIRRISRRFMKNPVEVKIQASTKTAPDIEQSYWITHGMRKNEALVRFLEAEEFDGAIVFVRTKSATLDVAEALERGGYSCAALNGDMNQVLREQTLERLKNGRLDVLIATDVAARGLDVDRIDLVVNYDIPMDVESYVHRIGRTGRAGRAGKALLFVENRERKLLFNIERTFKRSLTEVELPTNNLIAEKRLNKFAETVNTCLESHDIDTYKALLEKMYPVNEEGADIYSLAAALLKIAQTDRPLVLPPEEPRMKREMRPRREKTVGRGERSERFDRQESRSSGKRNSNGEMDLYRIEVGRTHGVEVRHIVGAIANEGDISSRFIGNIKLFDNHSTVELPKGMPKELLTHFTNTYILNKQMGMSLMSENVESERRWNGGDNKRRDKHNGRDRAAGHNKNTRDTKKRFQRNSGNRDAAN